MSMSSSGYYYGLRICFTKRNGPADAPSPSLWLSSKDHTREAARQLNVANDNNNNNDNNNAKKKGLLTVKKSMCLTLWHINVK